MAITTDDTQALIARLKANGLWPALAQDFYATGSWTPSFAGTTIAGSFTYTALAGHYVRIGGLVYVEFLVTISAITVAPTGVMEIRGLPFSVGGIGAASVVFSRISNLDWPAGATAIQGLISTNAVRLLYAADNAAYTFYPAANFTNAACSIIGSAVYPVAS